MTAPISLIPGGTRGHRPRLQVHLELELQCELNDARVRRADNLTESRSKSHSGHTEICMIKGIEEFSAELHAKAFGESEILSEVEIKIYRTRSAKDPHTGVTEYLIWGASRH